MQKPETNKFISGFIAKGSRIQALSRVKVSSVQGLLILAGGDEPIA